jgi:hypothetical protein
MSDITEPKGFGFPVASLNSYVRRFQAALNDEIVGDSVKEQLATTFETDFDAQAEVVAKIGTDQADAKGAVNVLTRDRDGTLEDVMLLCGTARDTAKAAFRGQDPLLHSEFFVGRHEPKDLDSIINRAEIIAASCVKYAEQLAAEGWSASNTKLLTDSLAALKAAEDNQQLASDDKEGLTSSQIAQANRLYRMCRAIQRVARVVYSRKKARTDPSVYAARAKFMLGEFPPRRPVAPPPADSTGSGTPPAGSGSAPAPSA